MVCKKQRNARRQLLSLKALVTKGADMSRPGRMDDEDRLNLMRSDLSIGLKRAGCHTIQTKLTG